MKITKMHALGNSYIYVEEKDLSTDYFGDDLRWLPRLATAVSDVRTGIGSDGLIVMGPSQQAEVRMRIFNADGSEAENCGNGVRCVAKYAYEHGLVPNSNFSVETNGGVVAVALQTEAGQVERVTVNMGRPEFGWAAVHYTGPPVTGTDIPVDVMGQIYVGTTVSVGNPHFVTFVADAGQVDVSSIGPQIERHRYFPHRINVEFVTPLQRNELDFRVWERGSGITYACGTGACASVAAGIAKGYLDDKVTVHLLGGDLEIERINGEIYMTGEAVTVFTGDFVVDGLRLMTVGE